MVSASVALARGDEMARLVARRCRLLEGPSVRAFYLIEQVVRQLVDEEGTVPTAPPDQLP